MLDVKTSRFISVILSLLILAGCELANPPSQTELLDEALPANLSIPSEWTAFGAPSEAVKGDWVSTFRDPNMISLVREGLRNNRDLVAAAANVEAALQTASIAGAPLLPQIGLEAGGHRVQVLSRGGDRQKKGVFASATWEIDLWGKLRAGRASARALAQAAIDDASYLQQSIAATIARSWIASIEQGMLIRVSKKAVENFNELLSITKKKQAAGLLSEFDVVQARSRLSAASAAVKTSEVQLNELIGSLEVLLGRYPSLSLKPAGIFPNMPPDLPNAGLPLSLLDRRPDIAAARNKVISAFYNSEEAKANRLPSISISVAGGTLFDPNLTLLGSTPEFLRIGASLLQPIFAGGAIEANVVRMSARQSTVVAEFGQTVLEAFYEVETALANEKTLREALTNRVNASRDATRALELANDRYVEGTIDVSTLLFLQQFQIERKVEETETKAALLTNRILLYMALGEDALQWRTEAESQN